MLLTVVVTCSVGGRERGAGGGTQHVVWNSLLFFCNVCYADVICI